MLVIETIAAVFGIVSGFATCTMYAKQIAQKMKQKKALAVQADALHRSLTGGRFEVERELRELKMRASKWLTDNRYGSLDTSLLASFLEADHLINSLASRLSLLASASTVGSTVDLPGLESMANQSRDLTVQFLQRLVARSGLQPTPSRALLSGTTATSSIIPKLGRTQRNVQNVCVNARLYRHSLKEFDQLATAVTNTNEREWTCTSCRVSVSQSSLRLSAGSEDIIWIGPVGFFKAHCQQQLGATRGWTCIWPVVASECNGRFENEKSLLEHMRDHHLRLAGQDRTIDWSADFHGFDKATCGFGATIGGQTMQKSEGKFLIPAPST